MTLEQLNMSLTILASAAEIRPSRRGETLVVKASTLAEVRACRRSWLDNCGVRRYPIRLDNPQRLRSDLSAAQIESALASQRTLFVALN